MKQSIYRLCKYYKNRRKLRRKNINNKRYLSLLLLFSCFLVVLFLSLSSAVQVQPSLQTINSINIEISIIIITFNKGDLLLQLLFSIAEQKDFINYEIILVDNGCTKFVSTLIPTLQLLHDIDIKYLPLCDNRGYSAANNAGINMININTKWVLFLNDDLILYQGFLKNYFEATKFHHDVGAVGCKLIDLDGLVGEAGNILWKDGSAHCYGRGENPDENKLNFMRYIYYASGACLMIRKDILLNYGGFQQDTYDAYYEDTDLCMHIRHDLNMRIVYQPKSEALHYEHQSFSSESAHHLMSRSKDIFHNKWHNQLQIQPNENFNEKSILKYRDAIRSEKKILFILKDISNLEFLCYLSIQFDFQISVSLRLTSLLYSEKDKTIIISDWLQQKGIEILENTADADTMTKSVLRARRGFYNNIIYDNYEIFHDEIETISMVCPTCKIFFVNNDEKDIKSLIPNYNIIDLYNNSNKDKAFETFLIWCRALELSCPNSVSEMLHLSSYCLIYSEDSLSLSSPLSSQQQYFTKNYITSTIMRPTKIDPSQKKLLFFIQLSQKDLISRLKISSVLSRVGEEAGLPVICSFGENDCPFFTSLTHDPFQPSLTQAERHQTGYTGIVHDESSPGVHDTMIPRYVKSEYITMLPSLKTLLSLLPLSSSSLEDEGNKLICEIICFLSSSPSNVCQNECSLSFRGQLKIEKESNSIHIMIENIIKKYKVILMEECWEDSMTLLEKTMKIKPLALKEFYLKKDETAEKGVITQTFQTEKFKFLYNKFYESFQNKLNVYGLTAKCPLLSKMKKYK